MTAGNSSGINDGAAAMLVVEAGARARARACKPLARVVSHRGRRRRPRDHGPRAVPATRKALARAGIAVGDLDLVELNEAFASQSRRLHATSSGSIPRRSTSTAARSRSGTRSALSGARLVTMLVHELRRRGGRYGLATMCIGVGQGIATVVERIED